MPEPKVVNPNKTDCGFWKRDADWECGACKVGRCECIFYPRGEKFCEFGMVARALYTRQQADREASR